MGFKCILIGLISLAVAFSSTASRSSKETKLLDYYKGNIEWDQDSVINLAKSVEKTSDDDYLKLLAKYQLARKKIPDADYSAIYDFLEVLDLSQKIDTTDLWILLDIHIQLGHYYFYLEEYQTAINWYEKGIPIAHSFRYVEGENRLNQSMREIAWLKVNAANAKAKQLNPNAIDTYWEAYEQADSLGSGQLKMHVKYHMGVSMSHIETIDVAHRLFDEIIARRGQLKAGRGLQYVAAALQDKANLYMLEENYHKAIEYLNEAKKLPSSVSYLIHLNLTECYYRTNQIEKAKTEAELALRYYPESRLERKHILIFKLLYRIHDDPSYLVKYGEELDQLLSRKEELTKIANKALVHRMTDDYYRTVELKNTKAEHSQAQIAYWVIIAIMAVSLAFTYYRYAAKKRKIREAVRQIRRIIAD